MSQKFPGGVTKHVIKNCSLKDKPPGLDDKQLESFVLYISNVVQKCTFMFTTTIQRCTVY